MTCTPTQIVQSFRLRFWQEPYRGKTAEWRGTIWHEQQGVHEKPVAVTNPEQAFEAVRRTLNIDPSVASVIHARAEGGSPLKRFPLSMLLRWFAELARCLTIRRGQS